MEVENALRLVGGTTLTEGTLQIYHARAWGSVCHRNFDQNAAQVACRQLGYLGTATFSVSSSYGALDDVIYLSQLNCSGNEEQLVDCQHPQFGDTAGCDSNTLVGVSCNYDGYQVRLADGNSSNEGRIEVYHNSQWGGVCIYFHDQDSANVACRSLGYARGEALPAGTFGSGPSTVHLALYWCYGYEDDLSGCYHSFFGCFGGQDVGVRCFSKLFIHNLLLVMFNFV